MGAGYACRLNNQVAKRRVLLGVLAAAGMVVAAVVVYWLLLRPDGTAARQRAGESKDAAPVTVRPWLRVTLHASWSDGRSQTTAVVFGRDWSEQYVWKLSDDTRVVVASCGYAPPEAAGAALRPRSACHHAMWIAVNASVVTTGTWRGTGARTLPVIPLAGATLTLELSETLLADVPENAERGRNVSARLLDTTWQRMNSRFVVVELQATRARATAQTTRVAFPRDGVEQFRWVLPDGDEVDLSSCGYAVTAGGDIIKRDGCAASGMLAANGKNIAGVLWSSNGTTSYKVASRRSGAMTIRVSRRFAATAPATAVRGKPLSLNAFNKTLHAAQ